MAFFQFGRKIELSKEYSLADIPVFSSLTVSEQKLIEKKARLLEFKRGDMVYEENTPPDAFYIVISGRFRLFLKARPGRAEKTLIYFHRGEHFSEASLLTGRMHSASVEAQRDGILLKLEKEDFLKLVNDFPTISLFLNRSLGYRLTKVEAAQKNQQEVKISSFYARAQSRQALECWSDLAASIAEETKKKVALVDFVNPRNAASDAVLPLNGIRSFDFNQMDPSSDAEIRACMLRHRQGFDYLHAAAGEERIKDEKKVSILITFLTYRYEFLLIRVPEELDNLTFKLLKMSDGVYLYSEISELEETAQSIKAFHQSVGFSKSEMRLLLPDTAAERNILSLETKEEILGLRIFSLLPSKTENPEKYQQAMRFVAKDFAGNLLGLALGSGAAYGLAQIGVLKVLEKEGIRPDIIVGSSIGALVGAFWAAGFSAQEIEDIAKTIQMKTAFFKLIGFKDLSIAHQGFFKGNQVVRWLESYLGSRTFRDMKIPLKIIAADLATSEKVVMESGRVVDAIRASISIPGIFRPVIYKDTHLIDGGVVDPLPIKDLSVMGVKKIIAVNVLPGPKDRIERNRIFAEAMRAKAEADEQKQVWTKIFSKGKEKIYRRYAVNIFHVIMSTVQFLEYEIAESWGAQADVLIHPIVRDAHWAEFYSPDKFIQLGAEKTELHLPEIKRLLAE